MSVDKVCDKQVAQYTGNQSDERNVVTSRDTTAPENEESSSGLLTDSFVVSLEDSTEDWSRISVMVSAKWSPT